MLSFLLSFKTVVVHDSIENIKDRDPLTAENKEQIEFQFYGLFLLAVAFIHKSKFSQYSFSCFCLFAHKLN